jgi:hypothetical protein
MEELQNFYLTIIAELKTLETNKLSSERRLPIKIDVHEKRKDTLKAKRLSKQADKQRNQIEKGYYKAIDDCIKRINKTYKETLKCYLKD